MIRKNLRNDTVLAPGRKQHYKSWKHAAPPKAKRRAPNSPINKIRARHAIETMKRKYSVSTAAQDPWWQDGL